MTLDFVTSVNCNFVTSNSLQIVSEDRAPPRYLSVKELGELVSSEVRWQQLFSAVLPPEAGFESEHDTVFLDSAPSEVQTNATRGDNVYKILEVVRATPNRLVRFTLPIVTVIIIISLIALPELAVLPITV